MAHRLTARRTADAGRYALARAQYRPLRLARANDRGSRYQRTNRRRCIMTLKLGDVAPDFTQESTEGPLHFHEWLGNSWGVLFSHPKDFTPVCTTELGAVARLKPRIRQARREGDRPVGRFRSTTTRAGQATSRRPRARRRTIPIIADADFKVSKLYGMLPASTSGDPASARRPTI